MKCSRCKRFFKRSQVVCFARPRLVTGEVKEYFYCLECRKITSHLYAQNQKQRGYVRPRRPWRSNSKYAPERTLELRAAQNAAMKRYYRRNTYKCLARAKVNGAIKKGILIRPNTCSECNQGGKTEAHHEDYLKPLEVKWLCKPCHDVKRRTIR